MRRIFYPSEVADAAGVSATYVRRKANEHGIGERGGPDSRIAFFADDLESLEKVLGRPIIDRIYGKNMKNLVATP